jgi:hypothetical protein
MPSPVPLAKHIQFFLTLRDQLKIYHWQTTSYSRHVGVDRILGEIDGKIDEFVEVFMGKYGRPRLTDATRTIRVANMSERQAATFVRAAVTYLSGPLSASLNPRTDTDLANIRDEMIGSLNLLLYLFTLK